METDYNDFADKWIALNSGVKEMHGHTLVKDWQKAGDCAEVCAILSGLLKEIFDEYNKK